MALFAANQQHFLDRIDALADEPDFRLRVALMSRNIQWWEAGRMTRREILAYIQAYDEMDEAARKAAEASTKGQSIPGLPGPD